MDLIKFPSSFSRSTLGAQVDGYIAVVGHTHICGLKNVPMTGPRADVVCAANMAAHVIQGLLRPGMKARKCIKFDVIYLLISNPLPE